MKLIPLTLMTSFIQKFVSALLKSRMRPITNATGQVSRDYTSRYAADNRFPQAFYENLHKTIHWTESIISTIKDSDAIDYMRIFRTFNPVHLGRPFYIFNDDTRTASIPSFPFNYNTLLQEALNRRPDAGPVPNIHSLGRIIRFEIDITTFDGAPAAENGFVDESDIPPIDTWFYITKRYLYCWIPTLFISKMQDVIEVEIFDSYEWQDILNDHITTDGQMQ